MVTRALTRTVPASFASALCATPPDPPIDVTRARAQHAAYQEALRSLGLEVLTIAADERHPDCGFIEDTAVVADGLALLTHPGAPSRRGEGDAVAAVLDGLIEVVRMEAPATLDGGDCMRVGRIIYVGRSARTSVDGVARLREVFAPRGFTVVPVALPASVLHLKCVCSPLGDDRVLLADGALPAGVFGAARVVSVPAAETYAANAVAHAGGVIIADGFPRTRDALEAAGFRVIVVANSEGAKADGSLTCMSILV